MLNKQQATLYWGEGAIEAVCVNSFVQDCLSLMNEESTYSFICQ